MSHDTIPGRIVEILTPPSGMTLTRSASEVLDMLNAGADFRERPLTIIRLRPRMSEMVRANIIEKVPSAHKTATGRIVAGWKLKGLDT